MPAPQSTPLPIAPQRNQAEAEFTTKANAFVSALEPFRQELQDQADFVNDATVAADQSVEDADASATAAAQEAADAGVAKQAAENARDAALAMVNFAGKWTDLAGALNTPATVFHNGIYWNLLNDLADVTTSEPGAENQDWLFVYSNAELRRQLLDEATLYADFVNGDYRLYEGVGAGLVRGKGFSDLFTFTRASSATGRGISSLETVLADQARFVRGGQSEGLLIEEQRTNLYTQSTNFASNDWAKGAGGDVVTVTSGGGPELFVGQNADLLTMPATSRIQQGYTGGSLQRANTWIVAHVSGEQTLRINTRISNAVFDIVNGTVESFSGDAAYITPLPMGFFAITLVSTDDTSSGQLRAEGAGGSYYVAQAQLEPGAFWSSPTLSEVSQATRAAEYCSRVLGSEVSSKEFTLLVDAERLSDNQPWEADGIYPTTASSLDRVGFSGGSEDPDLISVVVGSSSFSLGGQPKRSRVAVSYVSGGSSLGAINGATSEITAASPVFDFTKIALNQFSTGTLRTGKKYLLITVIPRALSASELEVLTQ